MKQKTTNLIFGITLVVIILIYIGMVFEGVHQMNEIKDYKHQIDSISTVTTKLKAEQLVKDSIIEVNMKQLESLNADIESEKQKLIKYKQSHHEQIIIAIKYTNAELDSFFTNRYK